MLQATDYLILRNARCGPQTLIELDRQPQWVCTLLSESRFVEFGQAVIHGSTVMIEDQGHDWNWRDGHLRFFARADETQVDLLVVFAARVSDDPRPRNFCPHCGHRLQESACPNGHTIGI